MLLTGAADMIDVLGWTEKKIALPKKQKELFVQLSAAEKVIAQIINDNNVVTIDQLRDQSGLSASSLAAGILNLELQNIITTLPGKRYQLL